MFKFLMLYLKSFSHYYKVSEFYIENRTCCEKMFDPEFPKGLQAKGLIAFEEITDY